MIENCQIIQEDSTGIIIEIDLIEYRTLLEDLTNSFFTKKISTRKVEKKIGHAYFVGNPFLTIKIYDSFQKNSLIKTFSTWKYLLQTSKYILYIYI